MANDDFHHFESEDKSPWIAVARYAVDSIPSQDNTAPISGVYAIRNLRSGNFYIGSSEHVIRRLRAHLSALRRGIHHSLRLQWAWKTRGEVSFEFVILSYCPVGELINREMEFVRLHSPSYNTAICMDNGMKGRRHTPEAIAKMSANRKGKGRGKRIVTEATRRARSKARAGKKFGPRGPNSEQARQSMSAAAILSYANGRCRGFKPVEINGAEYESCKAAAQSLKTSEREIQRMLGRGTAKHIPKI